MAIPRYLAMTAAEIQQISPLPQKLCWMSCLFSPYSTGLSNLPYELPPESLLMVADLTPMHGHDPAVCKEQLALLAEKFSLQGIVFDFQRKKTEEAISFLKTVTQGLPCPCAVSEDYAEAISCAVFLSSPPCHSPLSDHLKPWTGRDIWLELSREETCIHLTETGPCIDMQPVEKDTAPIHRDDGLHCHYSIRLRKSDADFQLWRTDEDLFSLLEEAEKHHVTKALALYQEFSHSYQNIQS